ncbi:MAG: 2-polyprenylphenol 6-hydroxylase [Minwuia sp.]|uniref:2-polyprenylphenol 6-hydroxylase n=1 Tax=Minwuia sp. TaxID=2493630 RepID=UPI003A8AD4CE
MLRRFRYLMRLVGIGWTLARHDALFPLQQFDAPPFLLRLAGLPAKLRRRKFRDRRPGERLAAALEELGPSFIKLGQALSVRADLLGEDIAQDLGRLRDRLPPFSFEEARKSIERELGHPIDELFETFDREPVAAASIAQVHFATVLSEGEPKEVAVKVVRPGIREQLAQDLGLFFWLAEMAERAEPSLRRLRPVDVIRTLQESVAIEMDFRLEAAAADEIREVFAGDADFRAPAIDWERTGETVLTMERVRGISLGDRSALAESGLDRSELAIRVIRIFLKQAMREGLFHADMHQGNLFVEETGVIVAVDFGIMGRLDRPTRIFMAEMLGAFIAGDYRRAAEVHFEAGYVPAHKSVDLFAQACRSIGAPIRGRPVSEISVGRLLAQLFQITKTFDMQTRTELLLLQKTMVTVEGVARDLDPEINFWEAARPVVEEWAQDNMGVEARVADTFETAFDIVERVPRLLGSAEEVLERFRAVPDMRKDAEEQRRRLLLIAVLGGFGGAIVGALLVALLLV